MHDKLKTLKEAATQVKSGTSLVMSANMQRSPMAFLREVVRQRTDSLRVIGVVGGEINIAHRGQTTVSLGCWAAVIGPKPWSVPDWLINWFDTRLKCRWCTFFLPRDPRTHQCR